MKPPDPARVGKSLRRGLLLSWKTFRRRGRRGLPGPRNTGFDDAVHDLRSSARRFHSLAYTLPRSASGKAVRRAMSLAERVLDWTGTLRDAAVEREGLKAITRRNSKVARGLLPDLKDSHDREGRKLVRRLRSLSLGKANRRIRKFGKSLPDRGGCTIASKMVTAAFEEVLKSRQALDPTDSRSVHRLRIALKRFRHVMELFEPLLRLSSGGRTTSVRSLQRTLGDLRDNEILSAAISEHGKGAPPGLRDAAMALEKLERRHSSMMTSFLRSVDAILGSWKGAVESFRDAVSRSSKR